MATLPLPVEAYPQLKAACVQLDVIRGQPAANLHRAEALLSGRRLDLAVLPELCTTGYLHPTRDALMALAEPLPDGPTLTALRAMAHRLGGVIVAGIAERDGGALYNTAVAVNAKGLIARARKKHLTRLEQPLFDAGDDTTAFAVAGATAGLATCFEAWFPEHMRLLMAQGASVMCVPANFGGPQTLDVVRVRAMENMTFAILTNRVGQETQGSMVATFRGGSRIIGPTGDILASLEGEEGICEATLDVGEALKKASPLTDSLLNEVARYNIGEGPTSGDGAHR